ncbi:hypothetical protein Taro_021944 [Colocasia esculenta]|uniref:Uncharacterized protein n=1 Tax=Colocasia esculenta TaxID=4460 RepID=A0A843V6W0_COLES|nr:hypothetical protein [Colocasia esculenta]
MRLNESLARRACPMNMSSNLQNRSENSFLEIIFDVPKKWTIYLSTLRNNRNEGGRSSRMKKRM